MGEERSEASEAAASQRFVFHSVLAACHCWLSDRKDKPPIKTRAISAWRFPNETNEENLTGTS